MNNYKHFSTFGGNIKDSAVKGTATLPEMLMDIKNPPPQTIELIARIRAEQDEERRAMLKCSLKSWTPAVLCQNNRRHANIIAFSGLIPLDFDKLPNREYSTEFASYLFNQYQFIHATWLSASGKGVRALVNVPIAQDIHEYRQLWHGLANSVMNSYDGFDSITKNPTQPVFQSYDQNLLMRDQPSRWTKKYIAPEPPPRELISIEIDDDDERYVCNIIRKSIDGVNDNGHPQLRGASFALGGYVGAGYISENRALDLIERLIDGNNYLSKKADVYKKTAQEMIKKGQSSPLYLKK
jgi:hypothetical protein